MAGQAKVQEVFNTLKLTETFDVKKFADAQTAQIVTLVVAIALTVCTGGMGGAAIGMALGAQGTAAVMINAAVIAMSSTMVGQLAGGGSFEQSFSAGLKAGATSALMAGVASGIDQFVNGSASTTTAIDSGKQVVQSGTNAASTGLSKLNAMMTTNYWEQTALNAAAKGVLAKTQGGSFKDGFTASVVGSLGASGAGIIGDNTVSLPLTNIVAHAALGCATAAAGKQDCSAGALGGAASASLARLTDLGLQDAELSKTTKDTIIAGGAVVGSMAVASALGKDVITAGNAAGNEVLNNYLTPKQLSGVEQAMAKCAGNQLCLAQIRDSARVLSASQDIDLTVAKLSCFLGFCERYDQIVATLKPLYDPAQVVKDVATLHPDWTKAQVANQAITYLTEAQKSLDAATWRTVFGTIEATAAVASAVGPAVSALRGAKGAVSQAEINQLAANGVKFTPEKILATGTTPSGQIVFLETGSSSAGLQHIIERHGVDFVNKGIAQADIPSVVMEAVTKGSVVGTNGSAPVYQIIYNGSSKYISVGVGSNGFIVRANPVSIWKPL